jgi:ribose transport system permease protein
MSESLRKLLRRDLLMVWIALAGLFVVCAVAEPATLKGSALLSMLPFAAILAVASVGQCLTVQSGGLDLSVPGSMALAAALVTGVANGHDSHLFVSIVVAFGAVLAAGLLNGLAITKLRITPIVATLAVNALLVGGVQSYSGGILKSAPNGLSKLAIDKTAGIPHTVILAAVFVIATYLLVSRTVWGRRMVAIGASPAASRAAGLRVSLYVIGAYMAAAFCFGTAGIVLAGYVQTPDTTIGDPYLFATITAVILGGTSFRGGRGRIVGTAVGAVFLSQLNAFLTATGAPASSTYVVQAAAIGIAATLNGPEAVERVRQLASRWRSRRRPGRNLTSQTVRS